MRRIDVAVLWDLMSDMGMEAVIRRDIEETMTALKHGRYCGILIFRDHVEEDPLEIILNVRDYAPVLPVIVVGRSLDSEYERILSGRGHVHVLPDLQQPLLSNLPELLSI
jgi:hypothetical protein